MARFLVAGPVFRAACLFFVTFTTVSRLAADDQTTPPGSTENLLVVLDRKIVLERDEWMYWQVDYRLRYQGQETLNLRPEQVAAVVRASVSNSRVEVHACPCESILEATAETGWRASAELLPNADEGRRCREQLTLLIWPESEGPEPPEALDPVARGTSASSDLPSWSIESGQVLRARLRMEHQHPLYGPFEALLGTRGLALTLADATLTDTLPMSRQRPVPLTATAWPPRPPSEFLDDEIFLSAPESLHLAAHVPGKQSYRFPDFRGVRYGSRVRLTFWYLVAPGTEGQCQFRLTQYRDLPNSWKTLHDGEVQETLSTVGRWVRMERVIRVEPEATSLTFDVRILGSAMNVGELWIDDVRLEPADVTALASP